MESELYCSAKHTQQSAIYTVSQLQRKTCKHKNMQEKCIN